MTQPLCVPFLYCTLFITGLKMICTKKFKTEFKSRKMHHIFCHYRLLVDGGFYISKQVDMTQPLCVTLLYCTLFITTLKSIHEKNLKKFILRTDNDLWGTAAILCPTRKQIDMMQPLCVALFYLALLVI